MNNEFLHMQKLAGIITEGQYKAKLNEITVGEFPQYLVNSLNNMVKSGELADALDMMADELSPEFKLEKVDGKKLITGNGLLISDNESLINRQSDEMEIEYDSIELNIPEVGYTELYYIWDVN
jgi:hypothetical protein